MKHLRKASLRSLTALAFVCALAFAAARADVRDGRVISARAGGVNYVAGDVKVRRAASADWVALASQDELKSGDEVRTGPSGRVEVLLNPGSYFRAGGGAEFTLASADLEDLRVELARGSAVVEATGYDGMDLAISVALPGGDVKIVRGGVYRFNAQAEGGAEVAVTSGRAVVGKMKVKGGNKARLSGGTVEVAKFDKKLRDDLDQWSRERGKELAKANERLNRRALRAAFGSYSGPFGRGWGSDGWSSGFWAYDPFMRCYTFLPYGWGWRSPYGYAYGTGVYPTPSGWQPGTQTGGGYGGAGTWGGGNGGGTAGGSGGSGGSGTGGTTAGGGGGTINPAPPTPVAPPTRPEPMERGRERTIEPGYRRDQ